MSNSKNFKFDFEAKNNDADQKYVLIFYLTSADGFVNSPDSEKSFILDKNAPIDKQSIVLDVPDGCPGALFVQLQWFHEQDGWTGDCNLSLQHVQTEKRTTKKETLSFLGGTVTVKLEINGTAGDVLVDLESILESSQAETELFSDAMDRIVNHERKPLMPPGACYSESFARSANLYSALMGSSVHPAAFFHKKWDIEDDVLVNLSKLALAVTTHYDGRPLLENDVIYGDGKEGRAMGAVLLSRFLAMYANCMPYLSDVDKRKGGKDYTTGEWFGDMILNQAGDCEDAGRVACQASFDFMV